jgi:glycosyltransferase involved in cell wall biosynthesis
MMEISVIIRFHNEARYLGATLRAVRNQRIAVPIEIIAVDNDSNDGSSMIAAQFADRVIHTDTYRPGQALNMAIEQACGKYIAVLSAHAIPANSDWLSHLHGHMQVPMLAGVYGGQVFNVHSKFLDKRDLDIFSTLQPRIEVSDTDFWNANSMFPRALWDMRQFDETVFELEDHYWTKCLTPKGYHVRFEPRSLVYHYSHIDRLDRVFLPLSSMSDPERIEAAISALHDPDANWPKLMCAGLELSSLTDRCEIGRAVPALGYHLRNHPDFDIRWRMAQALGKINTQESARHLVEALIDPSFYPRDEAAWSLARLGSVAIPEIERVCDNLPTDALPFAALALGRSGVSRGEKIAVKLLAEELRSDCLSRQLGGAYFAGELAHLEAAIPLLPLIGRLLDGPDNMVQVACWALGCAAAWEPLAIDWTRVRNLSAKHPHPLVRFEATVALGKRARLVCDGKALSGLNAAFADPNGRVRYAAIQSLRIIVDDGRRVNAPPKVSSDPDFGVLYEGELLGRCRGG